jgi:hypothetical protein
MVKSTIIGTDRVDCNTIYKLTNHGLDHRSTRQEAKSDMRIRVFSSWYQVVAAGLLTAVDCEALHIVCIDCHVRREELQVRQATRLTSDQEALSSFNEKQMKENRQDMDKLRAEFMALNRCDDGEFFQLLMSSIYC